MNCSSCNTELHNDTTGCPACEYVTAPSTRLLAGALRLRLIEPYTGMDFPLPSPGEVVIGRRDDDWLPDIDLADFAQGDNPGVSRHHAQVTVQGSYVTIKDLKSTNGTLVNGKSLHPNTPYALHDGDRIEFGQVVLVFRATM